MALKLKCLNSLGIKVSPNPEVVAKTVSFEEMNQQLSGLDVSPIEFEEWNRVEVEGKKKIMSVVFVPHTYKSELAKRLRERLEKLEKLGSLKLKVVEKQEKNSWIYCIEVMHGVTWTVTEKIV